MYIFRDLFHFTCSFVVSIFNKHANFTVEFLQLHNIFVFIEFNMFFSYTENAIIFNLFLLVTFHVILSAIKYITPSHKFMPIFFFYIIFYWKSQNKNIFIWRWIVLFVVQINFISVSMWMSSFNTQLIYIFSYRLLDYSFVRDSVRDGIVCDHLIPLITI